MLFGYPDAGVSKEDRNLVNGDAGLKHFDGERVAEHVAVGALWCALWIAQVSDLEEPAIYSLLKSMNCRYLLMVEAAGVEPDIGVENTQLIDSENASNSSNATIAKSSVQITYKDFPELQNFQASPALAQHAEVLFNTYTSIGCR